MFPGAGQIADPRGLVSVVNAQGDEVFSTVVNRRPVVSEQVAYQMLSMLRDVVDRGTGTQARALGVRGPVAGKTGTTDEYHDAWFVGFSSSVVAAVWVGFDTPATIGREAYAARVAVPIWADFMKRTTRVLPTEPFAIPEGLHAEELCSVSFLKPVEQCPTYVEYFKDGDTVPTTLCTIHRGTLKERATRAVQGFFGGLGRKLRGIFGR
jgi:membrane carboxypeptidase/penicillin-binding protein